MTDKQINTCEFLNICQTDCNGTLEDTEMCHCYELYKQLKCKEQECERLKQTLAEIKEISKTCSFTDNSELLVSRIEQILQLISEVENDRQD